MSTLQEFLNLNPVDNVVNEVIISDRFKDENGSPLRFKIKAMTNAEFEEARKKATTIKTKKGGSFDFDTRKFNETIIINHTINPEFKDANSIQKMGCITPEQYLNKVLLAGEIAELANQIQTLSGFDKTFEEDIEEAKN
ncbi:phage tail assembly chaperone [Desulfitobacterium chlororespirans]|uniref:Phage XkdN-like tail assembly chaperone protein, TAC n=1 Tax=Desulfitobacterium chlororespirans DSM 11544 TaxID=1121395 RepID=A0A1M7T5C7_9FIRM|nr:XkdN-like protein [Desulfitobacterium chlororespirans]SHN65960.1 Phage XkdN-like tail assembly chaperone protein, TAC [Desulfitobacterium chlororespirans DSM 11544]